MSNQENTRLRLVLDVNYNPNGMSAEALKALLLELAQRSIGNGMLTGDSPAEVETHEVTVSLAPAATSSPDAPLLPLIRLSHSGKNPVGYTADVARSGDPGIYDELRVGVYDGDNCVADVLVGLTEKGEPRVLCTVNGDGDGDPQVAVFPLRPVDDAISIGNV